MAHDVCAGDPRTLAQRRADALGALAAGAERLSCGCDNADCPARAQRDERASGVVIHVVAEASAVDVEPDAERPEEVPSSTAVITGGGSVPGPLLAELIRGGAQLRPVRHLGSDITAESGYGPSAALERFVRCRNLTCRFPNCDRPAEFCDIDHTIPYPIGPTHASNLKCLCRKHHLLKTFWTTWRDEQRRDGTIIWTSPSGHTYTTRPGSRLLLPTLCLPTAELSSAAGVDGPVGDRGVMMPRRRRTREQDRIYRIDAERALNAAHVAERNQPPPF